MGTMIQGILRSWSTYLAPRRSSLRLRPAPSRRRRADAAQHDADDRAALEQPESSIDPLEPRPTRTPARSASRARPPRRAARSRRRSSAPARSRRATSRSWRSIASKSGLGDSGEWVEIRSTRDCWLHLAGVSVESPRGTSGVDTASVSGAAVDLAPNGTFVVADSDDATKNPAHGHRPLLGRDDVPKNDGDTITVKLGEVQIDKVTYEPRRRHGWQLGRLPRRLRARTAATG